MSNHKAPEAIRARMRRVLLSVPILAGGEVVSEVYLRRPTARYMMDRDALDDSTADPAEVRYTTVMLATGLTRDEVLDIDLEDFTHIMDEVADFFGNTASQERTPEGGAV
ncbi:MAG: phage tail assembly protein [Desulfurellales bacterium]|nr:MAG: phage tail assembly protein [Desulfurellales bacterium]